MVLKLCSLLKSNEDDAGDVALKSKRKVFTLVISSEVVNCGVGFWLQGWALAFGLHCH